MTTDQQIAANSFFRGVTDDEGWIMITFAPPMPFHVMLSNPNEATMRAGRRATGTGDAVLGPFQIPSTGEEAGFLGVLPEDWR